MKKWLYLGVAAAGLGTLSGVLLPGARAEKKEEKKVEPAKDKPEVQKIQMAEDGSRMVEAINVAHQLIEFGRTGGDADEPSVKLSRAEALVLGARLLKQNQPDPLKDVPEGSTKGDPIDFDAEIKGLLKEAETLGDRDKTLAVLIDRVKEGARGSTGGAHVYGSLSIANGKTSTINRSYVQGCPATITVVLAPNPLQVKATNLAKIAAADSNLIPKLAATAQNLNNAAVAACAAVPKATKATQAAAEEKAKLAIIAAQKAAAAAASAAATAAAAQKAAYAAQQAVTASTAPQTPSCLAALQQLEANAASASAAAAAANAATANYQKIMDAAFIKLQLTGLQSDQDAAVAAGLAYAQAQLAAQQACATAQAAQAALVAAESGSYVLNAQLLQGNTVLATSAVASSAKLTYNVPPAAKGAKLTPPTLTIVITNRSGFTIGYTVSTN